MTPARLNELTRHITQTARKVLNATPIQEPWHSHAISNEMVRAGVQMSPKTVLGCLSSLKEDGLVKEPRAGWFVRVEASRTPITLITEEPTMPAPKTTITAAAASATTKTPFDRLADLALDARSLASKIEDVALEIEQAMQKSTGEAAALHQLKALLKGLA